MQTESSAPKSTVPPFLPWLVALGVFIFYLFTLHRWLTPAGLAILPQVTGWDWQPHYHAPLHFLLTYPIRWLPDSWHILASNLFATICASLSLALLARAVILLPHDRTRDQRQFERSDYSLLSLRTAWLPPVVAVLVCGLQYSFWLHAIVGTGEALDLLLFAYLVRCLLEARIDPRESWITRGAFVYGLAMTNNFAMIGFLPAFLLAVIWIKGYRFFDSGLIVKTVLWWLAGLALYLLLPLVNSLADNSAQGFWEMFRMNIGAQKQALLGFPRYILLLIGLTSLLPVLFIGIRWPASFGDISAAGNALTNLMTHVIHAVFLVACLYVTFDPPFSPRRLGQPYPLLPFYFLGALSVGYFTGYFLLVFGPQPARPGWPRSSSLRRGLGLVIVGLVWLMAAAIPAALLIQNWPEIARQRGRHLHDYGVASLQSLPPGGGIILSDDPIRLHAVAAAMDQENVRRDWILVETRSLSSPLYHRYLARHYPQRWPNSVGSGSAENIVEPATILELMQKLHESAKLFYLHPSFGYFFESFYLEPRQLVYQMERYPTNQVSPPPFSPAVIASNQSFWDAFYVEHLQPLTNRLSGARETSESDVATRWLGAMYSRQVNDFGVILQRHGELPGAATRFQQALALNPANPSAFINLDFNQFLQKGEGEAPGPSQGALDRVVPYRRNWNAILRDNGPVDEPNSCFSLSSVFARGGNYRQAAQQLERVVELQPSNLEAQTSLAIMLSRAGFEGKALERVAEIRRTFNLAQRDINEQTGVMQAEAWAKARQGNWAEAEKLLLDMQREHPQSSRPFAALAELYIEANRLTNAVAVFEHQLSLQPTNTGALINYSALKIQLQEYSAAIEVLNRILATEPNNMPALQNRAIAYLLSGQLDAAQQDYETLLKIASSPNASIFYGLGEIAFRKNQRATARANFERYLELAPRDTAESRTVEERLQSLKK